MSIVAVHVFYSNVCSKVKLIYKCNVNSGSTCFLLKCLQYIFPGFSVTHCPVLDTPENGNISNSDTEYLTEVTYACDVGYEMNATNDTKVCQSSGKWDPEEDVNCSSK